MQDCTNMLDTRPTMTKYACLFKLDGALRYCIWLTDHVSEDNQDRDNLWLDSSGLIVTFDNLEALYEYATDAGIKIEREEPILHDLDVIEKWLRSPRKSGIDCSDFLAAWNLFGDLISTIEGSRRYIVNEKDFRMYYKLFAGQNCFSITPEGCWYEPLWSVSEVGRFQNILGAGMRLFRERLPSKANT